MECTVSSSHCSTLNDSSSNIVCMCVFIGLTGTTDDKACLGHGHYGHHVA